MVSVPNGNPRAQTVCQVSYHRTARVLDTGMGLARLTLDQSLRVAAVSGARFSSDPGKIIFPGLILELKFKSHVPTIFKRLVEDCHLSPQTASKYRLGMAALNGYTSRIARLTVCSGNGTDGICLISRWPSRPISQRRSQLLGRLVAAMVLGGIVAQVYRHSRAEPPSSFTVTLVLLAILIAMVTQVIGDNVARAFSLVGALSIVRFRTVVRDTQDTAYVIFAVAVGMAVGAHNFWVAIGGIGVISIAAFAMRRVPVSDETLPFTLQVRIGLGHDVNTLINPTLDTFVRVTTSRT